MLRCSHAEEIPSEGITSGAIGQGICLRDKRRPPLPWGSGGLAARIHYGDSRTSDVDGFHSPHVATQRLRHADGAIGILMVFQHGDQAAAHGQAGTVEGVDVALARGALPADARARTPREGAAARSGWSGNPTAAPARTRARGPRRGRPAPAPPPPGPASRARSSGPAQRSRVFR